MRKGAGRILPGFTEQREKNSIGPGGSGASQELYGYSEIPF